MFMKKREIISILALVMALILLSPAMLLSYAEVDAPADDGPDASTGPAPEPAAWLFSHAAAGREHSLAVHQDGSLWAAGRNNSSQLGDGITANRTPPIKVMDGVIAVAAGDNHSLAIKDDSTLWE